eukprot:1440294-Prymnesium_polylepis.3
MGLGVLGGEPQAQLDGFRSRVGRASTVCLPMPCTERSKEVETAFAFTSIVTNSFDRKPVSPADARLINVHHASSAHTFVIELNDTARFNALGGAMVNALSNAIGFCRARPEAAFVLQGAGPHFCIGANPFEKQVAMPLASLANVLLKTAQTFCDLRELPGPVVPAVHGHVAGGGIALALNAGYMCAVL